MDYRQQWKSWVRKGHCDIDVKATSDQEMTDQNVVQQRVGI